jgi:hypothetical protein
MGGGGGGAEHSDEPREAQKLVRTVLTQINVTGRKRK